MKKAIKLTLAVVFVMGATSLFAQQKFGRINTQEIIVGMPETKEMQTNMEAYAKDLQDNLESMTVEYNQKLQEFQKNFNTLSESVRQLKENDLNALIQRRNEFEQAAQQDFQKRQNELLAPIIEKAKNAIDKVAAAGGYLAVFDTSTGSLAYFDEASLTDIAPAVKKDSALRMLPPLRPHPLLRNKSLRDFPMEHEKGAGDSGAFFMPLPQAAIKRGTKLFIWSEYKTI